MHVIKYERDSLKEYMLYKIPNEYFSILVSADNGFQQCYINKDISIIRIYFKIEAFNMPVQYANEEILKFLNSKFSTADTDWTVCVNEKRLIEQHKISFYYFSNILSTTLGTIKKIVSDLYYPNFKFDISAYYNYNKKYKEVITVILPLQTDYSIKYCKKYRMYYGSYGNTIVDVLDNMSSVTE